MDVRRPRCKYDTLLRKGGEWHRTKDLSEIELQP